MKKSDEVYKFDQFFTNANIAISCISYLNSVFDISKFDFIVEPSAGDGSFSKNLPHEKTISIEIDKSLCEKNMFKCMSFFNFNANRDSKYLVIGNPPFGTQNNLSVDFFNHAAKFADVIAFIIPMTWKKSSIQNRLDKNYHLIKSFDLSGDLFYGNKKTNTKCCFQIWKYSNKQRAIVLEAKSHNDWCFLQYTKDENGIYPPDNADFVMLAYGSKSGQISKDLNRWRPRSVHFIKSNIDVCLLIERMQCLDFSCSDNSARQSTLCRGDLVKLYTERYGLY